MLQTLLQPGVALGAIVAAWQVSRLDNTTARERPEAPAAAEPTPPPKVPQGGPFYGVAIQLHGGTDVYEKYNGLIPEIAGLGADSVLFVVSAWQDHAGSIDLHMDVRKTADADAVGSLCDLAARNGLRTILMPIVLLSHPRNNEWRGRIIPADRDWDTWFRRYRQFIVRYAKVAERHNVELFMVGSELIKTEVYADRWREVIAEVRQHYRGQLGYSANWDHYQTEKIKFWDALDYVGMTSYYELADGPNPSAEEVDANWVRIKKGILAFQREVNKPIIFTEVGWCSQEGAAHEGWNYYANQKATEAGQREQALLYQSFIKAWDGEPGVGGMIWWEWDTTAGGAEDYSYTPRAKPAEAVLRDWFAGKTHRPQAPAANGTAPRITLSPEPSGKQ